MKKFIFLFVVIIFILSCSGKESLGIDKTPPEKPELIPHLGDTGDGVNYYDTPDIELENNGIDATPGGNRIQIQWEHLMDSDIDIIEIYRFSEQEYIADTLNFAPDTISIVDYSEQNLYDDVTALTNLKLFYFINAIDVDGNSTYSDTVCYRLLDNPILTLPADNLTTSNMSEIIFEWNEVIDALQYRLLVFNKEDRTLIWQKTPLDLEDLSVLYSGTDIVPGTTILWRVDAFGLTANDVVIEENSYSVSTGSESEERILIVE
ncbi:MAG: hypothetical protein K8R49_06480 [Candidatus Cloacimonetes bacterium]|nr:hypothetical protein [Candidatus Cloacimonadota bacterium]